MIKDQHVSNYLPFPAPKEIITALPLTPQNVAFIEKTRQQICQILEGETKRKLLLIGPCSIHDTQEATAFAAKLKQLQEKVKDKYLLIMRTYFEKPRTTIGWKGLLHDPNINGQEDIELGIKKARELLLLLTTEEVPCATETLGPIVPQYLGDLVSWTSIGARTTESQTHRELASGLSMPVGFKNSTNGDIIIAVNAIMSAQSPHTFLGLNPNGVISQVTTTGNKHGHLVLRGGKTPNYDAASVAAAVTQLQKANLPPNIIIDCSHGNSGKDHTKQATVFKNVFEQMKTNPAIKGLMLESNLKEGNQKITAELEYGVSITDACISWEETEELVLL